MGVTCLLGSQLEGLTLLTPTMANGMLVRFRSVCSELDSVCVMECIRFLQLAFGLIVDFSGRFSLLLHSSRHYQVITQGKCVLIW